ncbi:hypothetical protein PLESTM_001725200 [Pleodorina starrii]|nr:hypothetical protein PLESTM_001725200 [Pleodorina starrii]
MLAGIRELSKEVEFKAGKPPVPVKLTLPGGSCSGCAPVVAVVVLTHGAGGDMDSGYLPRLASALAAAGVACVRFTCRTLHLPTRVAAFQAVLREAAGSWPETAATGAIPWFCGGHSMGGRAACQIAYDSEQQQEQQQQEPAEGHRPEKQPGQSRQEQEQELEQELGLEQPLRREGRRRRRRRASQDACDGKDGEDSNGGGGNGGGGSGGGGSGGGGRDGGGGGQSGAAAAVAGGSRPSVSRKKGGAGDARGVEQGQAAVPKASGGQGVVQPTRETRGSKKRSRAIAAAPGAIMEAAETRGSARGGGAAGGCGAQRGGAAAPGAAGAAAGGSAAAAAAEAAAAGAAAASTDPRVAGCVLLSYPLHPPDKPVRP